MRRWRAKGKDDLARPGTAGIARLDRRTDRLTGRLQPGDVAVLDHLDLDQASADALVACGVAAVINAAPSTSGRYPNLGPGILVSAGIPLLDDVGQGVFTDVSEGNVVRLEGSTVWIDDRAVASGTLQDDDTVAAALEDARAGLTAQLTDLAANATGFLLDQRDLLLDGAGIPVLQTRMAGRHVLVVAKGDGDVEELRLLRAYRRQHRPLLIGVDAGAEVLREAGLRLDVFVGDPATVSDATLAAAGEIVVRTNPQGDAPGLRRVQDLGLTLVRFLTPAASEDMALLVADGAGAKVLVSVGTATTIEEFLDRGRADASSTFLTRLRVGDRLVDARAAAELSSQRFPLAALLLVLLSVAVLAVVLLGVTAGHEWHPELIDDRWRALLDRLPW